MWRDETIDIITNEFPFISFDQPYGRYHSRRYNNDLVVMIINDIVMSIAVLNPFYNHHIAIYDKLDIISELYRILPKEFYTHYKRDVTLNSILDD